MIEHCWHRGNILNRPSDGAAMSGNTQSPCLGMHLCVVSTVACASGEKPVARSRVVFAASVDFVRCQWRALQPRFHNVYCGTIQDTQPVRLLPNWVQHAVDEIDKQHGRCFHHPVCCAKQATDGKPRTFFDTRWSR